MSQTAVQSLEGIDNQGIRTIERVQILLSVLLILATVVLWPTPEVWGGVVAGSAIAYFNFRVLRRVVAKLVSAKETERPATTAIRFVVKMLGLLFAIGFLILGVQVDAAALVIGFSTIVAAIFYEGIKSLF